MAHISVSKGLDIPIEGKPELKSYETISLLPNPLVVSLNLSAFQDLKFKLLVKQDEEVKKGQPLVEDKASPGRMFVAPASGFIKEIKRGMKRALLDIVIQVDEQQKSLEYNRIDVSETTKEELLDRMKEGGIFSHIYKRPFNLLANPEQMPRSIFVKALESAPFMPKAEYQVAKLEKEFQIGLQALSKLTTGLVHLVYHKDSTAKIFHEAQYVKKHTADGPHPVANASLHIQAIDPIQTVDDVVWILNAHTVVSLGYLLEHGRTFSERVISIAGSGILSDRVGFFKVQDGYPISSLIAGRIQKGPQRFISGDPLMGRKVEEEDFLGYNDYVFCVIPENYNREFLHFFRLGLDKYSFSKAYLSGHLNNQDKSYFFTTNQHGEHRPFIDSSLYDKVQPLAVPTMLLVKAVIAEDYELAHSLGLLEVAPEDFALPSFVDPSKIEMNEIIAKGLKRYAQEVLV